MCKRPAVGALPGSGMYFAWGLFWRMACWSQLLASTSYLLKHAAAACQPTFDILRGMDPPSQNTRAKALHGHQGSTALQAGGCRGDQARTLGQGALHKCVQLEARLVPKQTRGKAGARHILGARRSAVIGRGSQLPRHVLRGAAALGAAHNRSSGQSTASLCKRAAHLQARAQAALHRRQVLDHAPVEQRAARRRALAAPPPPLGLGHLLAPRLRRHGSVAIWLEPAGGGWRFRAGLRTRGARAQRGLQGTWQQSAIQSASSPPSAAATKRAAPADGRRCAPSCRSSRARRRHTAATLCASAQSRPCSSSPPAGSASAAAWRAHRPVVAHRRMPSRGSRRRSWRASQDRVTRRDGP